MYTCTIAFFAENIIRDAVTNRISAIGIMDDVTPAGFPFLFPAFSIAFWLRRAPEDPDSAQAKVELRIGDKLLGVLANDASFLETGANRQIMNLAGLVLEEPGKLIATISVNDHEVGRIEMPVNAPSAQVIAQDQTPAVAAASN